MPKLSRKKIIRKKRRQKNPSSNGHAPDFLLLLLAAGLTIFGLLMIYNTSAYEGFHEFNDKFYFAKQQFISAAIGLIGGIVAYKINYHRFFKLSPLILFGVLVLLVLVLIPGIGTSALGARRWIVLSRLIPGLPSVTIQPAEFAKPALIIYLASWLSNTKEGYTFRRLFVFLGIAGLVLGLVMLEPDLGTTLVIILSAGAVYFASGAPLYQFFLLAPFGIVGIISLIILEPYRLQRLMTFLNPQVDPQGASYHISQILITLGSGGLFGVGIGNSAQKYGYLPEATTDSIFAVIAGELGFVGAIALIFVFILFIVRALRVAKLAPDRYGQLLALGIALWIGLQITINMGSMVALMPLTGVPLPFISFGGSSLVTLLCAVGILVNISKYTKSR